MMTMVEAMVEMMVKMMVEVMVVGKRSLACKSLLENIRPVETQKISWDIARKVGKQRDAPYISLK
jgi:hypothetical protein